LCNLIRLAIYAAGSAPFHVYLVKRDLGYSSKPLPNFKVHPYTPLAQFNPASTAQELASEEVRLCAAGAWSIQLKHQSKTTKYLIPPGMTIAELLAQLSIDPSKYKAHAAGRSGRPHSETIDESWDLIEITPKGLGGMNAMTKRQLAAQAVQNRTGTGPGRASSSSSSSSSASDIALQNW
jgi:hypothetical protein